MIPTFNTEAQGAIDLAKRAVPEGKELSTALLLAALYHSTHVRTDFPELGRFLDEPAPRRDEPGEQVLADDLVPVLVGLGAAEPVDAAQLFEALLRSDSGGTALTNAGVPQDVLQRIESDLAEKTPPPPSEEDWRTSAERREVIEALSSYGRVLTTLELPRKNLHGVERVMTGLYKTLITRKRHSALVVGPSGTGKTALVFEFARRLAEDDPSVPMQLRGRDVFELSPAFLKAGASVVGQYEERLKALLEILTAHPKMIVFVDEVHSLLQSGKDNRGPFTDANEEFKKVVGQGDITLIGCTTLSEFRHYIEPDVALVQRFGMVRIEPPTKDETIEILEARLPRIEAHYAPLRIPVDLLAKTVQLTEDYLLGRYQPSKSIRLLDEACAWSLIQDPPLEELTEEALHTALEDTIGHGVLRAEALTADSVFELLTKKIVGQDEQMRQIAEAFVGGMGTWGTAKGTRRNFFFGGPTGTGKTQTALELAEILGGGKDALVRVDCNTLQGSGYDSGPAKNQLLGPPPGYVGYVRGQGGVLSKVRDYPEAIVLFDEIEKADPGVYEIVLQILSDGKVHDSDDNLLDFRRSFLIFTSNAGVTYSSGSPIGLRSSREGAQPATTATIDEKTLLEDLKRRGVPPEFLGREFEFVIFDELPKECVPQVIERQFSRLTDMAMERGFGLDWDPAIIGYLAKQWEPSFGVRHLFVIAQNRILEQLNLAEAEGSLLDVKAIRLEFSPPAVGEEEQVGTLARRVKTDDTLVITLT